MSASFSEIAPRSISQIYLQSCLLLMFFFFFFCRIITDVFIEQAVEEALRGSQDQVQDEAGIEAFKFMLTLNKGKTMLEFQELMTVFRLLQWNGTLKAMQSKKISREEVVSCYSEQSLNSEIRNQMAMDWVSREQNEPGIIDAELNKVKTELQEFRLAGRELRFYKEKRDILILANGEAGQV